MRPFARWFLWLLPLSMTARGQPMERVHATIDTLTSPALHGRGYVNEGQRHAAEWIAGEYQRAGLMPLGETYFQSFALDINTFPGEVALELDGEALEVGEEFIVAPASRGGIGKGKLLRLTSADFTEEARRRAWMRRDLRKRIVLYDPITLARDDAAARQKLQEAQALIELVPQKLTASLAPVQAIPPTFQVLKSEIDTTARRARFRLDAALQHQYAAQNVIGYLPGRSRPDSCLVISAHYDHLGQLGRDVYFPGANDNASGVSMLLELAHYFAQHPQKYTLVFMAFGAEEAGLIGSRYYTEHPLFPLSQIRFLLNLDLLGTGDEGMMVVNATEFPNEFARLEQLNARHAYLPKVGQRGKAANSDHYFFTERGVPAFFVYTLGGIAAYHDVHDRAATLPLTRYTDVFQLLTSFLEGF
ncbi:Peptidase family M28 [Catalinimonas alkaloidigena]|uniref:Peptidase family M28 n=1 Tax=Catalinimonas alkaloidigena TaxID=1075417 RepID=A0A1G9DRN5_9BACT|nr:M28 family peptidase [Catalinimonas alkaloidigena]SDK66494.1 Peptidase family M28 [Catalinimonas alkaloidigena]